MSAFTKNKMIKLIENQIQFSKGKSTEVFDVLIELIKKSLENGDDVLLSGFGKFQVREKKARMGRNPSTGKRMKLEKRRVVTFKCSGSLRGKINNPKKRFMSLAELESYEN